MIRIAYYLIIVFIYLLSALFFSYAVVIFLMQLVIVTIIIEPISINVITRVTEQKWWNKDEANNAGAITLNLDIFCICI